LSIPLKSTYREPPCLTFTPLATAAVVQDGILQRAELARHASARSVVVPAGTKRKISHAKRWLSKWARTRKRKRRRRVVASVGLGLPELLHSVKPETV